MQIIYETEQDLTEQLIQQRNETLERLQQVELGESFSGERYNMLAQLKVLNIAIHSHSPEYTSIQKETDLAYQAAMENKISIGLTEKERENFTQQAEILNRNGMK